MDKVSWELINETRHEAGFFVSDICAQVGISERSWYRWQRQGQGPKWLYEWLKIRSGDLSLLGWERWRLYKGVITHSDLNPKYFSFGPEHLLITAYCPCEGHAAVRREAEKKGKTNSGVPELSKIFPIEVARYRAEFSELSRSESGCSSGRL